MVELIREWLAGAIVVIALAVAGPAAGQAPPGPTLGPDDGLDFRVYGQPELSVPVVVAEDGTIPVPLLGPVPVAGRTLADAAAGIEAAYRDGGFLKEPVVTLSLVRPRSQLVAVLGEVARPGRYPLEARTTIVDLLAEAGGVLETGSLTVYLVRGGGEEESATRIPVDLRGVRDPATGQLDSPALQGGDRILVPPAEQFSVVGEVDTPGSYRLDPGMTVLDAVARAGGPTPRGSDRRFELKRRSADGAYESRKARLDEAVEAGDVIRVKERIF